MDFHKLGACTDNGHNFLRTCVEHQVLLNPSLPNSDAGEGLVDAKLIAAPKNAELCFGPEARSTGPAGDDVDTWRRYLVPPVSFYLQDKDLNFNSQKITR
ncbi:unnamed protein product [Schistocephalus solidus]|uniref:Transposase n=1 Tax=Schistocephalus solidus TaxID=70667 RepID=A0A183T663_SCHSO|nr:unnamed protein product [Schistocephalus solidus]